MFVLNDKFIFIALIIILFPGDIIAQNGEIRFNQLATRDGLSQSTVQVITQDREGFMWFGTQDGLNKYDGYNFTVYKYSPADPHSISDNDILALYYDKQNTLWIGTQSRGLNRFDKEMNRFYRYFSISDEEFTISSNAVRAILEDRSGIFWVGTSYGLNIMDRESESFQRITTEGNEPGNISNNQINILYEDQSGDLWIGTDNGLNRLNRDDQTFEWFLYKAGEYPSSGPHSIRAIHEDSYGTLWIGTEDRNLYIFDTESEEFKIYSRNYQDDYQIAGSSIYHILEDSDGKLWMGTSNSGLELYDRENKYFERFLHQSDEHNSINNNFITSLYESREGIIWVGTFGGGVNFLEVDHEMFSHYRHEPSNPRSLSNNTVRAFQQDRNGNVWIATDGGGLNRFDPETGIFERFIHDPNDEKSLPNNAILDMHLTEHGLWLTTYGSGIVLFDPASKKFRNFRHDQNDPESLSSDHVFVVHETSDGKLWFGTNWGGISVLDPGKDTFHRYIGNLDAPRNPETIGNNDVRSIFEDRHGNVWIGAYGEVLNRYNREKDYFSFYKIDIDTEFFASVIQQIYEDSSGRLWFASRGGGLMEYIHETDHLQPFTTHDGLPNNMIHAIEEDKNGNLWLSTNDGISRFDPVNNEFYNYNLQDGLQSREFSPQASMTDDQGYIYFGGIYGFNRFHPDKVHGDSLVPPVVLTELLLFNKPVPVHEESVLVKDISLIEKLVLDHSNSVITFGFTALNFSSRKGNEFAYKLVGFDDEWNYVGEQRRATYTNLKPGKYTFRVIASNNSGVWDETGTSLELIISPPFWVTGWFISLIVIAIAGCVVLIFRLRVRSIQNTNRRLEMLVSERTAELKAANSTKDRLFSIIAHDLNNVAVGFVGITDLLQHSVEKENPDDVKEYVGYLNQASDQFVMMLKNLLNWARAQTGRIQYSPNNVNLAKLANEIINQEKMGAINKGITLSSGIDPELYVYVDPDLISVVLRNLINNALKFTDRDGRVEVRSRIYDNEAVVSVIDNGIGMDDETIRKIFFHGEQITTSGTFNEKGTGIGLSLCKDFVRINGGELHVESKKGKGTTISFTLAVKKEMESAGKNRKDQLHEALA